MRLNISNFTNKLIWFSFLTSFMLISSLLINNLNAQNANITLTNEQIEELEKEPERIIQKCSERISLKMEPGNLCDAYYYYLTDKCERVDNLPPYCSDVLEFRAKKSDFEAKKRELEATKAAEKLVKNFCISNPPSPNDIKGINKCLTYLVSNSTYSKSPLNFTLTRVDINKDLHAIQPLFFVTNPTLLPTKIDIVYDIYKAGIKLIAGATSYGNIIQPASTGVISWESQINTLSDWDNAINNTMPYVVNGTYKYENSSSMIVSKQFNLTSQ